MCEARDLGIKWPQWRTLTFERQIQVDMRQICAKDVQKMLMKQARSTNWKKSVPKHEYEELKEGIWLEPALALLRKKDERRVD